MQRRQRSKRELRCFCSRRPLLAIWGNDEEGRPYVHVRVFKQGKVYGDIVARGGEVEICCRECLRWQRIRFVTVSGGEQQADLVATDRPQELDIDQQVG